MAADNEHQVISMEPKPQENPSSKKFDENGDEILQEGVCDHAGLCQHICNIYIVSPLLISLAALLAGLIILIIFIPLAVVTCIRAFKVWRLYLTRRGVYVMNIGCCWTKSEDFIPFSDITDVTVDLTNKIVSLRMDPETVKKHVPWHSRPLCCTPDAYLIKHVANAQEFADAVKREWIAQSA